MNAVWVLYYFCLSVQTKGTVWDFCSIPRYSFQLQCSLGFTMTTAVGALATGAVARAVRWVSLYTPDPGDPTDKAMAVLKVHVHVCSADAVLSSGSLCWDPWLWILYNHFSTGLVSRTVLSYPPRKKLDLSFHWLLWRVSCLFMRMLSLPNVHMGFIPVPFSNVQ